MEGDESRTAASQKCGTDLFHAVSSRFVETQVGVQEKSGNPDYRRTTSGRYGQIGSLLHCESYGSLGV